MYKTSHIHTYMNLCIAIGTNMDNHKALYKTLRKHNSA